MAKVVVVAAGAGNVIRQQDRIECAVRLVSRRGTLRGAQESVNRASTGIQAGRVERRADDAKIVTFPKKGLRIEQATLDGLVPFGIGQIGMNSSIGERPVLRDGLVLQIGGTKIRERILAGKVLIAILSDVGAKN